MNTYIALLRGINVSGQKKIPMAELRELLSKLGLENVQTYILMANMYRLNMGNAIGLIHGDIFIFQMELRQMLQYLNPKR